MKYTIELAIANFLKKNGLKEEDIKVTELDEDLVIIRVPNGNLKMLRKAEETIYHGRNFDIFIFQCMTGKSGLLGYSRSLTDDFRESCVG